MTRDQIIDAVQRRHLTPADREIAAAIVDMLGPKELEWSKVEGDWIASGYEIIPIPNKFMLWTGVWDGVDFGAVELGTYPTLEAAKAAAQAHHETEHWKRTRIWEDE